MTDHTHDTVVQYINRSLCLMTDHTHDTVVQYLNRSLCLMTGHTHDTVVQYINRSLCLMTGHTHDTVVQYLNRSLCLMTGHTHDTAVQYLNHSLCNCCQDWYMTIKREQVISTTIAYHVDKHLYTCYVFWFWRYLTRGAYLKFKSIFHKALNLF